jgi:hypothetical protein
VDLGLCIGIGFIIDVLSFYIRCGVLFKYATQISLHFISFNFVSTKLFGPIVFVKFDIIYTKAFL